MRTICIDFDGTIYPNMRFAGAANLHEQPIDGAAEALHELSETYRVVVHSARCATEEGVEAIRSWLLLHHMPYEVVRDKPTASAYIDDKAVCFSGDWAATLQDVRAFSPWQARAKACQRRAKRGRRR